MALVIVAILGIGMLDNIMVSWICTSSNVCQFCGNGVIVGRDCAAGSGASLYLALPRIVIRSIHLIFYFFSLTSGAVWSVNFGIGKLSSTVLSPLAGETGICFGRIECVCPIHVPRSLGSNGVDYFISWHGVHCRRGRKIIQL